MHIKKNILISNEVSYGKKGFKSFIGYKHGNKIKQQWT